MKESPLREDFREHRQEVRERLIRIEDKLDDHDHPEFWNGYQIVSAIVAVVGVAGGTLLAVLL